MYFHVGGGWLSVNAEFKLVSSEGDCEIRKIDLSTTNLHGELNGRVQTVEESKFCGSIPSAKDAVNVTTRQQNVGRRGRSDWKRSDSKNTSATRNPSGDPMGTPISAGRANVGRYLIHRFPKRS